MTARSIDNGNCTFQMADNTGSSNRSSSRWLGSVMASASDLWSEGRGFDSRPVHCQATTLGKLFTPIVPLSPSSIIWYLVWAFMLCEFALVIWQPCMGSMSKGSIVKSIKSNLLKTKGPFGHLHCSKTQNVKMCKNYIKLHNTKKTKHELYKMHLAEIG